MKQLMCLLVLILFLSGCATYGAGIFKTYPQTILPIISDLDLSESNVEESLDKFLNSKDRFLFLCEKGRIQHLKGRYSQSVATFSSAVSVLKEQEKKAIISASGALNQGASFLLNDNATVYSGAGYERIFLRHYQIMNYLFLNKTNEALVEVRAADKEQKEYYKKFREEFLAAQKETNTQDFSEKTSLPQTQQFLDDLKRAAEKAGSSFLNGYLFYLSAVIREITDDKNGAYIDYKRAYEIYPENKFVRQDFRRLSRELNMDDKILNFAEKLIKPEETAEVIIFYEQDLVREKEEISLPIPLIGSDDLHGITAIALPYYPVYEPRRKNGLNVSVFGKESGVTEEICDVDLLALKALEERFPVILFREAIRATAKSVAVKQANDNFGAVAGLLGSLYSIVTERADLRSWLTLPSRVHVLRKNVMPRNGEIKIVDNYGNVVFEKDVELKENQICIIRITQINNNVYNDLVIIDKK